MGKSFSSYSRWTFNDPFHVQKIIACNEPLGQTGNCHADNLLFKKKFKNYIFKTFFSRADDFCLKYLPVPIKVVKKMFQAIKGNIFVGWFKAIAITVAVWRLIATTI